MVTFRVNQESITYSKEDAPILFGMMHRLYFENKPQTVNTHDGKWSIEEDEDNLYTVSKNGVECAVLLRSEAMEFLKSF